MTIIPVLDPVIVAVNYGFMFAEIWHAKKRPKVKRHPKTDYYLTGIYTSPNAIPMLVGEPRVSRS